MVQSRTAQLIYQSFYCALGLVCIVAGFGIFDDITMFRWDFYIHFTNISNYFCIIIMLLQLIQTAKKNSDSYVSTAPTMKFIGVLSILLTFLVFNLLLAGAPDRAPQLNWRVGSILAHVVLPMMFIVDWVLFYEHGKVKTYYPFAAMGFPFAYMVYILIHAVIRKFDTSILIPGTNTPIIYPYFFVNLETQGVLGVAKWLLILMAAFVAVGFVFLAIDKLLAKAKQK